ncbi:MAG: ribosome-associated translation inhibitor RaiA [Endomicrobiales bacterium]|nr:ribosome-associated translation inhibitor RaiA [Endomicrobiales bacterium]
MQINITARHLELTKPLADYVRKKVERCERYFNHLVWVQVVLSVEKKYRQSAEVVIHAKNNTFRAKEESIDLYAAIDLCVDKMEKQLKKHKEISKVHRRDKAAIYKSMVDDIASFPANRVSEITEVKRFDVKPTTIKEAINEMQLMGYAFYMFLNADTSRINVVYQRNNGTYGILEPDM